MEDADVIHQVLNGDRDAYASLVNKYASRTISLCQSLLGASSAEDAAQEVFIKAYTSLKKFKGNSSFSTWIYRITYNHCLDLLRKKSRQKTESWDDLIAQHGEQIHELLLRPAHRAPDKNDQEIIEQVLSLLKPEYRLVLTLRELEGLSYEEIAKTTNSSLDSVKARLKRAREDFEEKLRHFLKAENV